MKRKRTAPPFTDAERMEALEKALSTEWTKSVKRGIDLAAERQKSLRRETGIRSHNTERQRRAERNHQKYRDIAKMLTAGNPQLREATYNRLAKEVRAELRRQGKGVVSARTIWEALRPKNKV